MSRKQDHVADNAPFGKYFHIMLNMADDDLNPYQYRLLGHYRRVCGDNGACWESTRTTAKKCKMSTGKVSSTRKELETTGYIHLQYRDDDTCFITLADRMAENIQRYCSPNEQRVHDVNASVHQVKQRITNEEKPDKKDIAASIDASQKKPRTKKPKTIIPRGELETRDVLYELLERDLYAIPANDAMPYDWGSMCGFATKWLRGEIEKFHRNTFGRISEPATPEKVTTFIAHLRRRSKIEAYRYLPYLVEEWRRWEGSYKPKPVATTRADAPADAPAPLADFMVYDDAGQYVGMYSELQTEGGAS